MVELMGRPKKRPNEPPQPGAKHLTVRGTPDWLAWVNELAAHCRSNAAATVDQALVEYARARGFEKPPPPRT